MTSNKVRSMHTRIANHLNVGGKKLKINSAKPRSNYISQVMEGAGAKGLSSPLVLGTIFLDLDSILHGINKTVIRSCLTINQQVEISHPAPGSDSNNDIEV